MLRTSRPTGRPRTSSRRRLPTPVPAAVRRPGRGGRHRRRQRRHLRPVRRLATPVPFPFVIGRDLVGTVAAVGADVVDLAEGDVVWSNSLGHAGRRAQPPSTPRCRLIGSTTCLRVPTAAKTVAPVHPAATAHLALVVHGRLRAGETVLVAGGAGHVGRAATVLARDAGARVVAAAGRGDLEECRRLGAEVVAAPATRPSVLASASLASAGRQLGTSGHHDLASRSDRIAWAHRPAGLAARRSRRSASTPATPGSSGSATVTPRPPTSPCCRAVPARGPRGRHCSRARSNSPAESRPPKHDRRLETGRAAGVRLVLRPTG